MKEWYSIADLIALGQAGLPTSRWGMVKFAEESRWNMDRNRCREVSGNGGTRKEYHYTLFPHFVQASLVTQAMIDEVAAGDCSPPLAFAHRCENSCTPLCLWWATVVARQKIFQPRSRKVAAGDFKVYCCVGIIGLWRAKPN